MSKKTYNTRNDRRNPSAHQTNAVYLDGGGHIPYITLTTPNITQQQPPSDVVEELIKEGEAFFISGDLGRAWNCYTNARQNLIFLDPRSREAKALSITVYNKLGTVYEVNGDRNSALQCYSAVLQLCDPNNIEALNSCARVLNTDKHYAQAIPYYKKLIALGSDVSANHALIGQAYMFTGQCSEAIPHYQALIDENPKHPGFYSCIAQAYQGCSRYGNAIDSYQSALALEPEYEYAKTGLQALHKLVEEETFKHVHGRVAEFARVFFAHTSLRSNTPNNDFAVYVTEQFQKEPFKAQDIDIQSMLNGVPVDGFPHIKICLGVGKLRYNQEVDYISAVYKDIQSLYDCYKGHNIDFQGELLTQVGKALNINGNTLSSLPEMNQENITRLFERSFQAIASEVDRSWVKYVTEKQSGTLSSQLSY